MDAPIDSDFKPKPKCQDAGSGTPGSTDHLANATICNMLAQFAGASGGASAGLAPGSGTLKHIMVAAPQVLKPGSVPGMNDSRLAQVRDLSGQVNKELAKEYDRACVSPTQARKGFEARAAKS